VSATSPSAAIELVSLAVSDGGLGAAVAQYEPVAPLRLWADDRPDGRTPRESMSALLGLRLPVQARLQGVGCTVVRPQDDGSWRIAVDAWRLAENHL
jgi:hypothetical protein